MKTIRGKNAKLSCTTNQLKLKQKARPDHSKNRNEHAKRSVSDILLDSPGDSWANRLGKEASQQANLVEYQAAKVEPTANKLTFS